MTVDPPRFEMNTCTAGSMTRSWLGIIQGDRESYLRLAPDWTPTLPGRAKQFSLTDILAPVR